MSCLFGVFQTVQLAGDAYERRWYRLNARCIHTFHVRLTCMLPVAITTTFRCSPIRSKGGGRS
jgi:hypothetical protein